MLVGAELILLRDGRAGSIRTPCNLIRLLHILWLLHLVLKLSLIGHLHRRQRLLLRAGEVGLLTRTHRLQTAAEHGERGIEVVER